MIRQATMGDLPAIASVHISCFPDSYSTSLGKRLLQKFYYEYLSKMPELFLVCVDSSGKVVGFCMGYYMERNESTKNFLKHNCFAVGIATVVGMIIGDRRVWKKLLSSPKPSSFEILDHSFDDVPLKRRGDLLSICVLPEYRGKGYAQSMMLAYLDILKEHNRSLCMLSVSRKNARGIRFYEKNGFVLYRITNGITLTYIKELGEGL